MKLRAPEGVGDPCVAGVAIAPRNGIYEVEADVGTLLIECFGFVALETSAADEPKVPLAARRGKPASARTPPKKI